MAQTSAQRQHNTSTSVDAKRSGDGKRAHYGRTPEWLRDATYVDSQGRERYVSDGALSLYPLLTVSGPHGSFPGTAWLARRQHCSRQTISARLAELRAVGAIEVRQEQSGRGRWVHNVYQLVADFGRPTSAASSYPCQPCLTLVRESPSGSISLTDSMQLEEGVEGSFAAATTPAQAEIEVVGQAIAITQEVRTVPLSEEQIIAAAKIRRRITMASPPNSDLTIARWSENAAELELLGRPDLVDHFRTKVADALAANAQWRAQNPKDAADWDRMRTEQAAEDRDRREQLAAAMSINPDRSFLRRIGRVAAQVPA